MEKQTMTRNLQEEALVQIVVQEVQLEIPETAEIPMNNHMQDNTAEEETSLLVGTASLLSPSHLFLLKPQMDSISGPGPSRPLSDIHPHFKTL